MIRQRLAELGIAVMRGIEVMRAAKQLEEVAQAVLEILGQAACSERAIFWTVDPLLMRPRATASWGALPTAAPTSDGDIRYRTASLSQGNAGHVWRSGKHLWSTSLVLDTAPPSAFEAGPRGGVWFAVKTDTSVYGVVELLGRALETNTPDNLVVVERLGYRLGYALEELRHGSVRGRFQWQSPTGSV